MTVDDRSDDPPRRLAVVISLDDARARARARVRSKHRHPSTLHRPPTTGDDAA